eukprot:12923200-Prorocentrum_lima.AAC.1
MAMLVGGRQSGLSVGLGRGWACGKQGGRSGLVGVRQTRLVGVGQGRVGRACTNGARMETC